MAFSSAVDGATEDCQECDAAGAGCVGRRAVPSQAGLVKGSGVAMVIALVWRGGWWIPRVRVLRALLWWTSQSVANYFLSSL